MLGGGGATDNPYGTGPIETIGDVEVVWLPVDADATNPEPYLAPFKRPRTPAWTRITEDEWIRRTVESSRAVQTWQGLFWKTRDGRLLRIAEMEDSHRAHVARMLVDNAAARHARNAVRELTWPSVDEDFLADPEPLTAREAWRETHRRQKTGEHLDNVRGTPLFAALTAGIEHLLDPGVVPAAAASA